MSKEQIAEVLTKYCVKPFGKEAILEYDIKEMAIAIKKWSYVYQVEPALALAQGIVESHWACAPKAKRSRRTLNIFNIGNIDSGGDKYFSTYLAGVEAYFRLMDREYRWPDDQQTKVRMRTMVENDFCRPKGGRYATAPNYTMQVFSVYNKIVADLHEPTPPPTPQPTERSAA
jgi:flagellum-specific peptidoglycan hydrolase FlgJ